MKSSIMKLNTLHLIVLLFSISISTTSTARVEAVIGNLALRSNPNIIGYLPATNASEIIISRPQYVISYNKFTREPNWVSWKIEESDLGTAKRSNNFQQDVDLEAYLNRTSNLHAVDPTEYRGTCFDRGHQTPSGDRTSNDENNNATFVMSNMIPQTTYLNRVIWEHFEAYIRTLIKNQGKKVYVIAGPIFDQRLGSIGPNKDILIPSKDFKVVFILDQNQTIANINASTPTISVIMPNVSKDGSYPINGSACPSLNATDSTTNTTSNNDWTQYQTTLAQVEFEAGMQILAR